MKRHPANRYSHAHVRCAMRQVQRLVTLRFALQCRGPMAATDEASREQGAPTYVPKTGHI